MEASSYEESDNGNESDSLLSLEASYDEEVANEHRTNTASFTDAFESLRHVSKEDRPIKRPYKQE